MLVLYYVFEKPQHVYLRNSIPLSPCFGILCPSWCEFSPKSLCHLHLIGWPLLKQSLKPLLAKPSVEKNPSVDFCPTDCLQIYVRNACTVISKDPVEQGLGHGSNLLLANLLLLAKCSSLLNNWISMSNTSVFLCWTVQTNFSERSQGLCSPRSSSTQAAVGWDTGMLPLVSEHEVSHVLKRGISEAEGDTAPWSVSVHNCAENWPGSHQGHGGRASSRG